MESPAKSALIAPILHGRHIVLRPLSINDDEAVYRLRSQVEVMEFIHRPLTSSVHEARELILSNLLDMELGDSLVWAICQPNDDELIGMVGFWRLQLQHQKGEIGYLLDPRFKGRGYASEAVQLVLKHVFITLGWNKVEADILPQNHASIRVVEKAGFKQELLLRDHEYWEGQFYDQAWYGLTRSDYLKSLA
jgi:ribosomal-protein-alanine N-acetyltransferase